MVQKMVELKLNLPDDLAREAKAKGLLTPEALENLLRSELRRERVKGLFDTADRLADLGVPPMTRAEIEEEIRSVREQRGVYRARGA